MTDLALIFCARALTGASSLPPADRADLYDYAATLLQADFPQEAAAARDVAKGLRDSEAAQTLFTGLLSRAANVNSVRRNEFPTPQQP